MLLGVKTKKIIFLRYLIVIFLTLGLYFLGFYLNKEWSADMAVWKALGFSSFILLFLILLIGPLSVLFKKMSLFLSWRRELGVIFALTALIHGILILNGWIRWDLNFLLGNKFYPQVEIFLRSEPGFGLANLMGLLALFWAILLASTSFDKVVSYFGIYSWKWLHNFAYVIFYIIVIHAIYFSFIHYLPSPERVFTSGTVPQYPSNPIKWFYLSSLIIIFFVQLAAFVKIVKNQRRFIK